MKTYHIHIYSILYTLSSMFLCIMYVVFIVYSCQCYHVSRYVPHVARMVSSSRRHAPHSSVPHVPWTHVATRSQGSVRGYLVSSVLSIIIYIQLNYKNSTYYVNILQFLQKQMQGRGLITWYLI